LSQCITYGRQLWMCPQNCFGDFVGHPYLPVARHDLDLMYTFLDRRSAHIARRDFPSRCCEA
jgi:hypothetical protein